MKNISLTVLFSVLSFVVAAQHKADTTERINFPPAKPEVTNTQPSIPADFYNSVDPLIRVRLDAIPSPLKKTLEGSEYSGWQESPVFRNRKTSEFLIDIRSGDSIRTFHFDKFGNPLKD
jgi:hypothetical protein